MKKSANAAGGAGQKQAESKPLEARFAALTSGLLARKGQAAPSQSQAIDVAPELAAPTPAAPPPAARTAPAPPRLEIINERSADAGYPDNPGPDDFDDLDFPLRPAPARPEPVRPEPARPDPARGEPPKPVARTEPAKAEPARPAAPRPEPAKAAAPPAPPPPQPPKAPDYFDVFDDLDDEGEEEELPASIALDAPRPSTRVIEMRASEVLAPAYRDPAAPAPAPGPEKRVLFQVRLTTRDFLRLELGAAELGMTSQELVNEAIVEYLDACGVDSLAGCQCLEKAVKACETSPRCAVVRE